LLTLSISGRIIIKKPKEVHIYEKNMFVLILFFYSSAYALEHLDYLHVISYEGDIAIKKNDTGDWIQIDLNIPVEENDTMWVPKKSRLELRTKNGSFVRLNEYSLLNVLSLSDNGFSVLF